MSLIQDSYLNDVDYDGDYDVAERDFGHDCDYYLNYYYYFVALADAENFSYFSYDDFGTIFSPEGSVVGKRVC